MQQKSSPQKEEARPWEAISRADECLNDRDTIETQSE